MADKPYQHKVRLRVCGLLVRDDAILLVQVHSPVQDRLVWIPPGGGVEYGELLEDGLKREFKEETGLEIEIGDLQFINELIEPPYHAIELYFEVKQTGGELSLGSDPEHSASNQLLKDVKFLPIDSLAGLSIGPEKLLNHLDQD